MCCDVGNTGVPGSVVEYGFDNNWIIAKRASGDYWIIDKRFQIDWSGLDVPRRHEFYESHITGDLSLSEFEQLRDNWDIRITMRKVD